MDSQGSPPLFSQTTTVGDSQHGSSQDADWAAFMQMAKAKGLDWAKGILNGQEPVDSGVVVANPGVEQPVEMYVGPSRPKRARRLNKDFPAEVPAQRISTQEIHREAETAALPSTSTALLTTEPIEKMVKLMDTMLTLMFNFQARLASPVPPPFCNDTSSNGEGVEAVVNVCLGETSEKQPQGVVPPAVAPIITTPGDRQLQSIHVAGSTAASGSMPAPSSKPPTPQPTHPQQAGTSGNVAQPIEPGHLVNTPVKALSAKETDPQAATPMATDKLPLITVVPLVSRHYLQALQLPLAAKEAIWQRVFVNIFTLLMHGVDTRKMGSKEDKKIKYHAWPDETIENWLEAFSILSLVVMEKHPEQGPCLLQYSHTIHNEAIKWGGMGWYNYDKGYRRKMAMCPELGWDQKDIQLWVEHMGPCTPQQKDSLNRHQYGHPSQYHFGRRQFKQPFRGAHGGPGQRGGFKRPPTGTCRLFNAGFCSWGEACTFVHSCNKCGAPHPVVACYNKRDATAFNNTRQES